METTPSTSELIYLYLDGETTPVQETVLFESLAANSELQAEFREAITLRDTFTADRIEQPPVTVTNAVFQRVGMVSPFAGTTAATGLGVILAGLVQRFAVPMLSAVSGGIVTLSALWLSGSFDSIADRNSLQPTTSNALVAKTTPHIALPVTLQPATGTDTDTDVKNPAQPTERYSQPIVLLHKQRLAAIPISPDTQSPASEINSETAASAVYPVISSSPVHHIPTVVQGDISRSPVSVVASVFENMANSTAGKFSFQARSFTILGGSGGTTPEQMPTSLLFNNAALGIFYHLDEWNAIGLEAGAESFEHYTFTNDTPEFHSQILWGSAVWRHIFIDKAEWNGFQPFSVISAGITAAGPMARGAIGLSYTPEDHISVSAGIEASSFIYSNPRGTFSAQKIGLSYSLNVRL